MTLLLGSAVSIALVHTIIGIDHTLPFVVLGRAEGWSLRKTLVLTGVCGVGHVVSSVVLGLLGIGLGVGITSLDGIEASRGSLAAWTLIVFGLGYAAWSLARQRRRARETHAHSGGVVHSHTHGRATHQHPDGKSLMTVTAWSLFVIFVLGPCEPLIPLLMIPAATMGTGAVLMVTGAFTIVTIGTMLVLVTLGYHGLQVHRLRWLERHGQVAAGLAIAASGMAIQVLGI